MTTIYLLRHGDYQNPKKLTPFRLPGFPLSSQGKKQASQIAKLLKTKNIDHIYSSPILRTRQTANIVAKVLNLKPNFSTLLSETDSPLQGTPKKHLKLLTWSEIFTHKDHLQKGGETLDSVALRTSKIVKQVLKAHSGKTILLVSHGDTCMTMIYQQVDHDANQYLKQSRPNIPLTGLVKFQFKNQKLINFTQLNY